MDKGDTLESLSEMYSIAYEKLLAANEGALNCSASDHATGCTISPSYPLLPTGQEINTGYTTFLCRSSMRVCVHNCQSPVTACTSSMIRDSCALHAESSSAAVDKLVAKTKLRFAIVMSRDGLAMKLSGASTGRSIARLGYFYLPEP